ncbi:MAG TPA: hypothetical protein PLM98_08185 [Thiolinea sp.]|nr:hypothetical protein [Thiolinea sp.]
MKTINYKHDSISQPLKVVNEGTDIKQIWRLRQSEYGKYYPAMNDAANDVYDNYSCILYSEDETGDITSTGRLVLDGNWGLPADEIIHHEINLLRKRRGTVAEPSRFAISDAARGILPTYLRTYYRLARENAINSLIFITRDKNIGFYRRALGANLISKDVGYNYGTDYKFSLLEWEIKANDPIYSQA